MTIPIDWASIANGIAVSGFLALCGVGFSLLYRLWRIPEQQQEIIDELRLLRRTLEERDRIQFPRFGD